MVIPFAPALSWYQNDSLSDVQPRHLNRTWIAGPQKPVLISVPLQKGTELISNHGNWMHAHLGSLNATYGKAPFFNFLFPDIERIYKEIAIMIPHGVSIHVLNLKIHQLIMKWIDPEALELMRFRVLNNPVEREILNQVKNELSTNINTDLSILDAIFRLGKKIVFLI